MSQSPLLRVALLLVTLLIVTACELEDQCDADVDPTCEDPGVLSDTGAADTGIPNDTGGQTDTTPGRPQPRYLWIYDFGSPITGSHPGPDIDAVELILPTGSSVFGRSVTDSYRDSGIRNNATDTSQALGAPFNANGSCNVEASPSHWYSLADGGLVIDFGREIPDGSRIVVYECQGVNDNYGVSIGLTGFADDDASQWEVLIDDASGTTPVTVDYATLGF
jgi:hypothetical protein